MNTNFIIFAMFYTDYFQNYNPWNASNGNAFEIKDASDFNLVITVPAIILWKHRANQIMREAAYMVIF